MDRATLTYRISSTTTLVTNPLGGGLYILVPYLASAGIVQVTISGGVVTAPWFRRTTIRMDTNQDWAASLTAATAPWADFETSKFLLHVPTSWVSGMADAVDLMRHYDLAIDGASEWLGLYPPFRSQAAPKGRHRHVLFLAPDLHIKETAYGVGYPQVNVEHSTNTDYGGWAQEWMVRNPTGSYVTWHELGHACFQTKYYGEEEAMVNYLLTCERAALRPRSAASRGMHAADRLLHSSLVCADIRHVKYGDSYNDAFKLSLSHNKYFPDQAAVHWMVTPNFRDGNEMDHSATPFDEFRYQARGFAKYSDLTRLFGWECFTAFYHQESLDKEAGVADNSGLAAEDYRTLRWSVKAGEDVTPLIEFYGIFPHDANALKSAHEAKGLAPGDKIRCLLTRYKSLIPADNAAFRAFYLLTEGKIVDPGSEDVRFGRAWFWDWRDRYQAAEGTAAKARRHPPNQALAEHGDRLVRGCLHGRRRRRAVPGPTRRGWIQLAAWPAVVKREQRWRRRQHVHPSV